MQSLFRNLPKENIKVSRQNNNDALQTYIICIKTSRLLPYTFSETCVAKGINLLSTKSRCHCIHVLMNVMISWKIMGWILYISEIRVPVHCQIESPFTYTYRESLIYTTAFFTYWGMFSVLFSVWPDIPCLLVTLFPEYGHEPSI